MSKADDLKTWRNMVVSALAVYGASLTSDDRIQRLGTVTGVYVKPKGKRLCFGADKHILATTPQTAEGVAQFVEKFWFWKPSPAAEPADET